jgi:hypothetical protein
MEEKILRFLGREIGLIMLKSQIAKCTQHQREGG